MNRRRWPIVLLALAGVLAALLGAGLSVGDLEEALVRDAAAVVATPLPRPSHVDRPVPGRFSDALRPAYGPFLAGYQAAVGEEDRAALLGEVARGERPLTDLPPDLLARLAALAPLHDAVLAASHAASADLGPDHAAFGPFTAEATPGVDQGDSWLGLQYAARLSAIRTWLAPDAAGRAAQLPRCLDMLALGRDAAVSGGLIGHMHNAATTTLIAAACGASLDSLPPDRLPDAVLRLRVIRDAVPPLEAMLVEEMVQVRLLTYGPDLPEHLKARLPARPRAFADDGSMRPDSAWQRAISRLTWRPLERFQDEIVEAARLPTPEREAALARAGTSHRWLAWLLGLPEEAPPAQNYARYARLDEAARLRLDLLVAAAAARLFRARSGDWPDRPADLRATGLLRDDEAARLALALLAREEGGTALRLVLPLPHGDEAPASEATLLVRAAPEP